MNARQEIIQYLGAELEFGERMIKNHMADGHLKAVECREKHREKLTRWLNWLKEESV